MSGHGSFSSFLCRIGKKQSPDCPCGNLRDSLYFLTETCSFSNIYISLKAGEPLWDCFLRIKNSRHYIRKTVKIYSYNKLNENFSIIFPAFRLLQLKTTQTAWAITVSHS